MALPQLSRKLQIPKSTCHALLLTFERCKYVEREQDTGRYRLGLRLYALANMALCGISLRDQAEPFLFQLMRETRLTVHLAILEQGEAILIHKVEPPNAAPIATWVGKRMGLHCTSLGKALISRWPEKELRELVKRHGMVHHKENTIGSLKNLKQVCERFSSLGAVDDEEEELGCRCIGAPILDSNHQVLAAISISGTTEQITDIAALSPLVLATADRISRHLGFF